MVLFGGLIGLDEKHWPQFEFCLESYARQSIAEGE